MDPIHAFTYYMLQWYKESKNRKLISVLCGVDSDSAPPSTAVIRNDVETSSGIPPNTYRMLSAQIIELSTTWDFRRRTICNIFQFKLIGFFLFQFDFLDISYSPGSTQKSQVSSANDVLWQLLLFSQHFCFFLCFWLLMFCGVAIVLDWSWCAHLALEAARKSHSHRTMENDYESVGWSAGRTVIV